MSTVRREFKIYHEAGAVGVIVTDLDTELWATGSHRFEWVARRIALRRLAVRPSGTGKRPANRTSTGDQS